MSRPSGQGALHAIVTTLRYQDRHMLLQGAQQLLNALPRPAGNDYGLPVHLCCRCCRLLVTDTCCCCRLLVPAICCFTCRLLRCRSRRSRPHQLSGSSLGSIRLQQVCLVQHPQLQCMRRQRQRRAVRRLLISLRLASAGTKAGRRIGHVHHHMRLLCCRHRAPHPLGFNGAVCLAQARAVYEDDLQRSGHAGPVTSRAMPGQ